MRGLPGALNSALYLVAATFVDAQRHVAVEEFVIVIEDLDLELALESAARSGGQALEQVAEVPLP